LSNDQPGDQVIRRARRDALRAGALAFTAIFLVGCGDHANNIPTTAPSPSSAPPAMRYELVDDLCDHVNLDAISNVLPHVDEALHKVDNPVTNARSCTATLGVNADEDEQGALNIYIEVFDDNGQAADHYDNFYTVNVSMSAAKDVTGIGQKAYQFVVPPAPGTPSVRVLDGNAVISCEWYPLSRDGGPRPDGLVAALTETIRGTMRSLRTA
jgi:hypothetical protein